MRRERLKILIFSVYTLGLGLHLNAQSQDLTESEASETGRDPAAKKKSKRKKTSDKASRSKVQESPDALRTGASASPSPAAAPSSSSAVNDSAAKVEFSAKEVWNVDIFKDESHKVLVIQDRKYTKAGKFEFGPEIGKINSSPFYRSWSAGLHMGYHFNEYVGVDTFFTASTSTLSGDGKQIDQFLEARQFGAKKEFQEPKLFGGVGIMWSPIYGKFAFFRQSIIHFDVYGTAGLSVLTVKSNVKDFGGKNQTLPGTLLGVGTRVFLSNAWSIRLDLRNNIYRSYYAPPRGGAGGSKLLRSGMQFTLGASYLL